MDQNQINRLLALFNRGDMSAVLKLGKALLRQEPNIAVLHNILGAAEAATGQGTAAIAHFRKVIELTPGDAAAHSNLGIALQDLADAEGAVRCFEQAIQLNPTDAESRLRLGEALRTLGRSAAAMEAFTQVAAMHPNHPAAHASMGIVLKDLGRMREAINCFSRVVELTPDDPAGLLNLGGALGDYGRTQDAIDAYMRAIKLVPDNPAAYYNLGVVQKRAGMLEAAASSYHNAIARAPENAEYHNILGLTLRDLGRRQDALTCFAAAIKANPESAEAYNNLGFVLSEMGKFDEAIVELQRALSLRPGYPSANTNLVSARNHQVPRWHVGMMNDAPRNEAFFRGIREAVGEGDLVLEIGTGSGLLAMKAADSGAGQVITCEMEPAIATVAKKIVAKNGFGQIVTVLNKKSTDLHIPDDMPDRADVVIAEVLSSEFVGEGVVASLRDARSRLLADGGKMVPAGGSIMVALLADMPGPSDQSFVGEVGGYDLSGFNMVTATKIDMMLKPDDVRYLSDPITAFSFDFYDASAFTGRTEHFEVTIKEDGDCIGILQWNLVDLGAGVMYENDPRSIASHWSKPLYRLQAPRSLKAGQNVTIEASLAEDRVWFRLMD